MKTLKEIAEYCGVCETTVHRWCRQGLLPAFKFGRQWRVDEQDFLEWCEACYHPQTVKKRMIDDGQS